jgi:hypothetical protein
MRLSSLRPIVYISAGFLQSMSAIFAQSALPMEVHLLCCQQMHN